jgi:catechol 2,3-dioxygenase-like lactoylglutathione lyase family enzyme
LRINGVMAMVMVQDIERALRFYRDFLGFTVQDEQEDWVVFHEGVSLGLSPEPAYELNVALNAVMVTLVVDDVQSSYEELISKGVAFFLAPQTDGGATFATLRDSEGNLVQLLST